MINQKYKCMISAHEDRHIRFFDMNSNKIIKNLVGHTDAVTSLSINKNSNHVASVSHDGSMRIWDVRKFQCLYEIHVIFAFFNPLGT